MVIIDYIFDMYLNSSAIWSAKSNPDNFDALHNIIKTIKLVAIE